MQNKLGFIFIFELQPIFSVGGTGTPEGDEDLRQDRSEAKNRGPGGMLGPLLTIMKYSVKE